MDVVIGIDSSTTGTKAVAFDANGDVVRIGRAAIERHSPEPTWHEQHARDWWTSTVDALSQVAAELAEAGHTPVALGIAHQRESFVLLDEDFAEVRPAILWLDARADDLVGRLGTERVHALSGKPPSTTPSIYKIGWLAEHEPESLAKARYLADVHGYLARHLTGRFATSIASADPTALIDMGTRDWSDELAALVGVERSMLAEVVSPGTRLGGLTDEAAARTGLPAGLPVFAGAGDGQSGGLGAGVAAQGQAYLSLGTSIVVGAPAPEGARHSKRYRIVASALGEGDVLEAFVATGALSVSWFRSAFPGATTRDPAALEAAVERVPPGSNGLKFLPYLSGAGTPYWDGRARGAFLGIDESHDEAAFFRAVLEGLAFEIELLVEGLETGAGPVARLVVMGGGAASGAWLQIIADVLRRPLVVTATTETAALGAAMLAARGVGFVDGDTATVARAMSTVERVVAPRPEFAGLYAELCGQYRQVYPALKPLFQSGAVGR